MATQANLDYVQKMFVAYLGRAASASAQEYYADLIDADAELGKAQLFDDLYNSAEAQALYSGMSNDQIIEQIFQNCFNRDPAFAGLTYYYDEIAAGTFNILEAAAVIANDAGADDAAILSAKQTAADKVTTELGSDADAIAAYAANADEARTSLNKVTDTASAASYDAAAEVEAISGGNQIGASHALTTGVDIPAMTGDNDTVTGTLATYGASDVIADSSTTDNDTVNITTTDDITAQATISGVENINYTLSAFTTTGGNAADFDVALHNVSAGTVTLDLDQGGSTIANAVVTGARTGITINTSSDFATQVDVDGGTDNESITVNTAAATTNTTSQGTLAAATITSTYSGAGNATISSDTDGTITAETTADGMVLTAATAKTVVATSAGVLDANTTDIAAATSVNLTAGGQVDVGVTAAAAVTASGKGTTTDSVIEDSGTALKTVNLSGNGGAVDFDLTAAEAVTTINMTGDQSVRAIVDASEIDALTGNAITVTDSTTAGTTVLEAGTAAGDMDLSAAVVDNIVISVDNNAKSTTVRSGQTVTLSADQTATTIDGVDSTAASNSVTIILDDESNTGDATVDVGTSLTLTDFGTATIDVSQDSISTGAALTASSITALTASADNTSVTIEAGANGVTLAGTSTTGTGSLTINSSGAVGLGASVITAGSVTSSGSGAVTWTAWDVSKVATLTTGSGGDAITISGTNGNATLNTGGANDTIIAGANSTAAKTLSINGGDGALDTLNITAGTDLSGGTVTISNIERLDFDGAATVPNAFVNGSDIIVSDVTTGGTVAVTVAMGTTDTAVDLSDLTIDTNTLGTGDGFIVNGAAKTSALTLTGSSLDDTLTGGTKGDTVSGGAGADVITGNAGADTLTGGEAIDHIYGGAGADSIVLTETTAVADRVQFVAVTEGSTYGAASTTLSGNDVITGFKTGTDKLIFDSTANDDGTADAAIVSAKTVVAGTAATNSLNDLTAANYTSVDQVVAFLLDAGTGYTVGGASAVEVVAVTIGSGASAFTAIYIINDSDGGTDVDAGEVALIATVDATLVAGDLVI